MELQVMDMLEHKLISGVMMECFGPQHIKFHALYAQEDLTVFDRKVILTHRRAGLPFGRRQIETPGAGWCG